jgi:hypothetical protein
MALLRLIAAISACVVAAGCGQAGAEATASSGLLAPAGWKPLPDLAQAVAPATKAAGVTIDGTEAWGETAIGCYALWLKLHGVGATSEAVMNGLDLARISVRDVVAPEPGEDGLVALTFERPPYRGRLRARMAGGSITALACFANDREPSSCDQPCTTLLGGLP